jgi:hypothetical protein
LNFSWPPGLGVRWPIVPNMAFLRNVKANRIGSRMHLPLYASPN